MKVIPRCMHHGLEFDRLVHHQDQGTDFSEGRPGNIQFKKISDELSKYLKPRMFDYIADCGPFDGIDGQH